MKLVALALLTFILVLVLIFSIGGVTCIQLDGIDPEKTIAWGPGLNQKIDMYPRYFFLQLVALNGQNVTENEQKYKIVVRVKGYNYDDNPSKMECSTSSETLDCKDGTYVVRYQIKGICDYIKIDAISIWNGLSVYGKVIKGPFGNDSCQCPYGSFFKWQYHYGCYAGHYMQYAYYLQIEEDLEPYQAVNFDMIREGLIREYVRERKNEISHYVVKSNRIYRLTYGTSRLSRTLFIDAMLLTLSYKLKLPDVEFFVNLGDWPIVPKNDTVHPIFSVSGSVDTNDIVIPSYELTESSMAAPVQQLSTASVIIFHSLANVGLPWRDKTGVLYWRGGARHIEELDDLMNVVDKRSDLFNISTIGVKLHGKTHMTFTFLDYTQFKYRLYVEGVYRLSLYQLPYLLAGGSLVFKQESKYYEFFNKGVESGVHYIPVNHDFSDLIEKVTWAKNNDKAALKIVKAARQFAKEQLLPQNIICYYGILLHEWSKRIQNRVRVLNNMLEVKLPERSCYCNIFQPWYRSEM